MPSSIGGLASGLNTTEIINALLSNEQVTRNRLTSKQAAFRNQLSVWQDLGTKLGALKTAATALSTPTKAASAIASSDDETLVGATASSTAPPATFTFRVQQLAAAHQVMASGFTATTDLVGAGTAHVAAGLAGVGLTVSNASGLAAGKYEIDVTAVSGGTATVTFAGKEQTVSTTGPITLTDNNGNSATFDVGTLKVGKATIGVVTTTATTTLAGFATAINSLGIGASAAAVDTNNGTATPTRFVLSSREAGTGNTITHDLSGLSGFTGKTFNTLRAATDSVLVLADGTTTITRSTNRLTDVVPGVTLDLRAADTETDVTVTVSHDDEYVIDSVQAVVDSLNSVLAAVKKSSATDPNVQNATGLAGDTRLRLVSDRLVSAMRYTDTSQDKQVLNQIGITLDRSGAYQIDETKLRAALASDHAGTIRLMSGDGGSVKGVLGTLTETIQTMLAGDGLITGAKAATDAAIKSMNGRLERENQRLSVYETRIRRQYTNLESTMAQLSSQANGLTRSLG